VRGPADELGPVAAKDSIMRTPIACIVTFSFAACAFAEPLPRVLLIGDSISGGYNSAVVSELAGVATVERYQSYRTSDALANNEVPVGANYTTNLGYYLGTHDPYQVIHFNWGLHDLKNGGNYPTGVPLNDHLANLGLLLDILQATGAKLIFATTTPIPEGAALGRVAGSELPYNQADIALMQTEGVAVDDLHTAVWPHVYPNVPTEDSYQQYQNVHFTSAGYAFLGERVADAIRAELPEPTSMALLAVGSIGALVRRRRRTVR
jgi:acyl-CoA thioesterase-1